MRKLIAFLLSIICIASFNVVTVKADSFVVDANNFVTLNTQDNDKRIEEVDVSKLIPSESILSQPHDILIPGTKTEWNMVTKFLSSENLRFFNFDEETMISTTVSTMTKNGQTLVLNDTFQSATLNSVGGSLDDVKTYVNRDGNISLYTESYLPNDEIPSKSVVGGYDGRQEISNPNQHPYRMTGYLSIKYNNVPTQSGATKNRSFRGTAFLEGPNLIVTAGHCLYADVTNEDEYQDNKFNPTFPDEVIFYPAKNGVTNPYGGISITEIHIDESYYTNCNTSNDWGACTLESNIGNTVGWNGKISCYYEQNHDATIWGYPLEVNGQTQYSMWQDTDKLTALEDGELNYLIDASGGQSGAPIVVNLDSGSYVCGIHTYGSGTSYNIGTQINNFMFSFLQSFVEPPLTECLNNGVYEIRTKRQFNGLRSISTSGKTFKLMNDIDLGTSDSNPWTPIPNFYGVLNGNGYKVTNMSINTTANTGWFGLFATNAGRIENLTVTGQIIITGSGGQVIAGLITGINWSGGVINNCQSSVSAAEGNFIASTQIHENGGYTAWNFEFFAQRHSAQVGGIVGENQGTVSNCVNYSEMFGNGDIGGVVGRNFGGTINNCINRATINLWFVTNRTVGGIVGYVGSGTISNCKNEAQIACVNPSFSDDTSIFPQMGQIIGRKVSGSSYGNSWTGSVSSGALHGFYYSGNNYHNQAVYVSNGEIGLVG